MTCSVRSGRTRKDVSQRFVGRWPALILALLAPALASAQSGRFNGKFQELEATHDVAYQAAVISVAGDALRNLVGDESWNPEIRACLETWIKTELAPDYDDLVASHTFDLDRRIRGQWALEGNIIIEMGFLNRWLKAQLTAGACGPEIVQRRTVYIEPADVADAAMAAVVEEARTHVQQLFGRNGYSFVDQSRRQYAQFRLILDGASFSTQGPVKSLTVKGMYVDNRVDDQPYLAFTATAADRLKTTEGALDQALLEIQAQKILAQVREWEATHIVEEHDVVIVFLARSGAQKADAVLDAVVTLFELPAEFRDRPDALQVTNLDEARVEISIFIPARYGIALGRSRMEDLRNIARDVLGYDVAASSFSDNATRLTIVDAAAVQASWEREFWRYLGTEQLVLPENQNALAVVRRQLAANPGDATALGFLDEIVSRLVQRAIYKLGQGALSSASADLTLAETIGADRPGKPWASARQELVAAKDRQQGRLEAQAAQPVRPQLVDGPPFVLFPQLEAREVRGISVAPADDGLRGLAADLQGIKSIEINGTRVGFARAADANSAFLSLPGAPTEEFRVPPDMLRSRGELAVVVVDGANQRTARTLVYGAGAYTVRAAAAPQSGDDSKLLAEGEAALGGVYHALIIANQDYQRVSDLATPLADAEALKRLLIEQYTFADANVKVVPDATRAGIEAAIDALADDVGPNDSLLIYFAGHGYQDKAYAGTGYWIPVDGQSYETPGHRTSWVANEFVADYVEKVKARHVLLVSDSCYAGTFAQRGSEQDYFIATPEFARRKAGLNSRRAITSGDIEPVRDTGGHGHSIFAHHLLQALSEHPGDYLTAEQLHREIRKPVTAAAPQTPQYFVMSENDRGGDFVFVRRD